MPIFNGIYSTVRLVGVLNDAVRSAMIYSKFWIIKEAWKKYVWFWTQFFAYPWYRWAPLAYFSMDVYPSLPKPSLKFNISLAKCGLNSLVRHLGAFRSLLTHAPKRLLHHSIPSIYIYIYIYIMIAHYNDVDWAAWYFKLTATLLSVQQLVQPTTAKVNAPYYWFFVRGIRGHRWIPFTNDQ